MKSFFKAYIITNIIFEIIGFGFIVLIVSLASKHAEFTAPIWIEIIITRMILDIVLMLVIALPFFLTVRKFNNFSWIYSILMWFFVLLAGNYISLYLFGIKTIDTMMHLLVAAVMMGFVFIAFYKGFKKRADLAAAPIDKVFN